MSLPEVSAREKLNAVAYWRAHADALRQQGVSDKIITCVCWYTNPDAIGYEQGQIRADPELGKWDMYSYLMECLSPEDRLVAAGLSASEVAAEDERDRVHRIYGIDPDDPEQVAEIEELERLTPDQVETRIRELSALLEE